MENKMEGVEKDVKGIENKMEGIEKDVKGIEKDVHLQLCNYNQERETQSQGIG